MTNQHTFSNALGICGNISSMFLFLSPLPTFIKIVKTKDVGQFTPAPYVLTVLNCCFWICYGLPAVKNLILVISINSAGLVIEFIYVSIYMLYAKGAAKRNTGVFIGCCCVLFAVVVGVTLGYVKQMLRWKVIGSLCVSIGIIQNFAPLMVIKTVIKTKSAEFLPILLSLWILINGGLWTAYGCWPADIFIIIPNAFGIFFGIIQVLLWCVYRRNPKASQVTDTMYGKTTTPDEKLALEEPDDSDTDYFREPPPSRLVGGQRTYSFSPMAMFKLEELLEDIKANEWDRNEAEKARQRSEDERVLQETKRELAERAREKEEIWRQEAERRRERDSKRQERWDFLSSTLKTPPCSP